MKINVTKQQYQIGQKYLRDEKSYRNDIAEIAKTYINKLISLVGWDQVQYGNEIVIFRKFVNAMIVKD